MIDFSLQKTNESTYEVDDFISPFGVKDFSNLCKEIYLNFDLMSDLQDDEYKGCYSITFKNRNNNKNLTIHYWYDDWFVPYIGYVTLEASFNATDILKKAISKWENKRKGKTFKDLCDN